METEEPTNHRPHPLSTKETKVQTRFLVVPKVLVKTSDSKTHRSRSEESSLRRVCARVARRVSGHMCTSTSVHNLHTKDSYQGHKVILKGFFLIEPSLLLVAVKFN